MRGGQVSWLNPWPRIRDWFSISPQHDVLVKAGQKAKDYYGLEPMKEHFKRVKRETAAFQFIVPDELQVETYGLAVTMAGFRNNHRERRGGEAYCLLEENACVAHHLIQAGVRYGEKERISSGDMLHFVERAERVLAAVTIDRRDPEQMMSTFKLSNTCKAWREELGPSAPKEKS